MATTPRPIVDSVVRSVCGRRVEGGELLARVHSVAPDRGVRHELTPPDDAFVARVVRVAHDALGPPPPRSSSAVPSSCVTA